MKKPPISPIFLTVVYLTIVATIGLLIICSLSRRILDSAQYHSEDMIPISQNLTIRQTIRPKNNGLDSILIFMKNTALSNREPFRFRLLDNDSNVVREIKLNGYNIGEADNVRFDFPPVVDSGDRNYIIELMSDTREEKGTIKAGVSAADWYAEGQLVSPFMLASDLSFQMFYRPTSKISLINQVKKYILGRVSTPQFLGLAGLTSIISFFGLKKIIQSVNTV